MKFGFNIGYWSEQLLGAGFCSVWTSSESVGPGQASEEHFVICLVPNFTL